MRTMAVLLVLLLAMGLRPLCCDEATDGATPAACDLYCEWNGVDFSHWLFVAFLETGE